MKKKKLLLLWLSMLVATLGAAAQGGADYSYLPSNYGGWTNLSASVNDLTYDSGNILPMQSCISGNTLHVAWFDFTRNADGKYCLYYRRSTDLGRTWESARAVVAMDGLKNSDINGIGGNYGSNALYLAVEGQNVHIVTINSKENGDEVLYTYSHNGGKTFETRAFVDEEYRFGRPHVVCNSQMLVIAFQGSRYGGSGGQVRVYTSFDGGGTFKDCLIETTQNLADVQASGRRWAVLGNDMYWNYNMWWGNVYLTTSADGGQTFTTQNIAPLVQDNTSWCELTYMVGQNGNAFNYHPQMTLDGTVINVIFKGCAELVEGVRPTDDRSHTIFRRSTDFGQTWTDAKYIPGTNGSQGAIAAKGQHIYVLQATRNPRVYHSHDGGQTWDVQTRCVWSRNSYDRFYELYIAPDDPTGQHVYMTGVRGLLVESRDGFRTVDRNFVIGIESWNYKNWNNEALTVLVDQEGTEHWLMNFSPSIGDVNFWNIVHRRNDLLPATGSTNMALDISRIPDQVANYPLTNVIVPMTPSIMETKDATTVECWVRVDEGNSLQIAGLSNDDPNTAGNVYNGGWYIGINSDANDWFSVYGSVSTELSVDGTGKAIWDRWRYQLKEWGKWHHVALTYDSHVDKDNIRLYMDGLLLGVNTEHGPLRIGNNPIVIGRKDNNSYYAPSALVDNFAIYSRALTQEEILEHIYNTPDVSDRDCRLLLTFDGSLQDKSQYHNDPAPLLDALLVEHDGIRPPHPEFTISQDVSGQKVYLNDMTQDGEACWWVLPDPYNLDRIDKYSTKQTPHVEQNVSGHPGTYRYDMVARGTGDCNAYAAAPSQYITIGGLKRVYPESAAQADGVSLHIEGGYRLTYYNKPRVVLHGASGDIEGVWCVERGYDSNNVFSPDDLAPARFNLSGAPTGKYDVIVGNDTLFQAFTVEPGGEPEVWADVNGYEKMLWGRYQKFTINYGNRSNTPAFNVPFILGIPTMNGQVDVAFDFDISEISPDIDEDGQALAMQATDYMMIYDEQRGDSIRCYMFLIPYIGPNSTEAKTFRVRYNKPTGGSYSNVVDMYYMIQDPWGAEFTEAGIARAPHRLYSMEQMECMAFKFGQQMLEDGVVGQLPGIGCLYNAGKTVIQGGIDLYYRNSEGWVNFGKNFVSAGLSCAADLTGVGAVGKCMFIIGSMCWSALNTYWNREDCLKGPGNKKNSRAVNSYDPNEMIGPLGADENAHYIQPIGAMPYTITFENKSTATAPANEVWITDTLDLSKLDASTFCFQGFGWANQDFTVGGQLTKDFTQNIPLTVNGHEIMVRVSGLFDEETGVARWNFVSLEKNGNELEDIMNGFLAPNNDDHVGEGYVNFTIDHKPNPASGSTVSNQATIIFDSNDPIATNVYTNTFDTDYPTSAITDITERDGKLIVTVDAQDGTSGIDHFDLFVFESGTDGYTPILNLNQTEVPVSFKPGKKYGFCVLSTDRVGWLERKNLEAEVEYATSLKGDVNGDGNVNISDVNLVISMILSSTYRPDGDVNGDGVVNISDINAIISIILQ